MTSAQVVARLKASGAGLRSINAKFIPIGERLVADEVLVQSWNARIALVILTFQPAEDKRGVLARELFQSLEARYGPRNPGRPGEVGAIGWAINRGTPYECRLGLVHLKGDQSISIVYSIGKRIATAGRPPATSPSP